MPLLVVPLRPDQTAMLTLEEWDRLRACNYVAFERDDHPLMTRLVDAGVAAAVLDGEVGPDRDGSALVAEPRSPRVVALARAGAVVASGPARAPDVLTAAHGAPVVRDAAAALATLALVMARLRSEDGCPWDREQSHRSLSVHLLEEAYEVIDSIDRGELTAELEDELGDVLLQVFFHSRLAEQDGRFDVADVARRIVAKLIRRHPHVFGDVSVSGSEDVLVNWEAIKAEEKQDRSDDPFEGLPKTLPALLAAYKTQKRAARLGFSVDEDEAKRRVAEALASAADGDSIGRALFWLTVLAARWGVDPEAELRRATLEFRGSL